MRTRARDERAVSPVVATLILILVAVAAAAALYLWLVAWQGSVTGGIGSPSAQYTVTIGGSTSVFPFSSSLATWFEQNNSDVVISNNEGGTGAGMIAVCDGNVDVGAASSPQTATGLQTSDGCPASDQQITITTIAYDAVDLIVPSGNTHGLYSMSADTLDTIYIVNSGGASAFSASKPAGYSSIGQMDGVATGVSTANGAITWNLLPACVETVNGATWTCGSSGYGESDCVTAAGAPDTSLALGAACAAGDIPVTVGAGAAGQVGNDIIAKNLGTVSATYTSPCGFTVCAGGTNDQVQTWSRADSSGTEQTFEARLMGIGNTNTGTAGLGYTGCGGDNQLDGCGLATIKTATGNPGVISGVAGSADAIGFASDGLARATGSGVSIIPFDTFAQVQSAGPAPTSSVWQYGAVNPTTGGSGSIAGGITSSTTVPNYAGWRPFQFVTLAPPTGEVERFFQFVLDPNNNQQAANYNAEISIYSI